MPRNYLHDPTRIDLLFTMSEITHAAVLVRTMTCETMFSRTMFGRCRFNGAVIQARLAVAGFSQRRLVEPDGIEPTTSCLQSTRSPS